MGTPQGSKDCILLRPLSFGPWTFFGPQIKMFGPQITLSGPQTSFLEKEKPAEIHQGSETSNFGAEMGHQGSVLAENQSE